MIRRLSILHPPDVSEDDRYDQEGDLEDTREEKP